MTTRESEIDWASLTEPIARLVWGKPSSETANELRWGSRGSRKLDRHLGTWFDHEKNVGGGALDLVPGADTAKRMRWLTERGLIEDRRRPTNGKDKPPPPWERPVAAVYPYRDQAGKFLFEVVRFGDALDPRFMQRRGEKQWGLGDARRTLYRLREVVAAIAARQLVVVVEGERDADNLCAAGFVATTNPMGANKWRAEYSVILRGADIVIIGDNDQPGRDHVAQVAASLHGIARRIRVLDLAKHWPDCPKGGDISDWLAAGHSREELDTLIEQAMEYQRANDKDAPAARGPGPALSAEAVMNMRFDPIKYVVPGVIVEGLTLLAGKPKVGKSWLLLHAALAVARGGFTLGEIKCREGDVLYCALEDNLRRLQSRMTKLIGLQPAPKRLFFRTEMPRLLEGGLDVIRGWLKTVPEPRLIIIDTLAMVRAPKKHQETSYEADYAAALELRALASEHGLAIVLAHHLRKADADDAFDTVSGTLGLTGAPDSILVLKRDNTGTIVLHGHGRDLMEIEQAMAFDRESCLWRITGDASEVRRSSERAAILEAIDEAADAPIGPNVIAAATGMKATNVRSLLGKLVKEGVVERETYGKYRRSRPTRAAGAKV